MASTVTTTDLRLDKSRRAKLYVTGETAVDGSTTTIMDAIDVAEFNRFSVQIFNSDGAVAGTVKVWGSIKDPATVGGANWTQIGDDITVNASSNALKAISTTPVRWLSINAVRVGGANDANLTCYVYAQQV